MSKITPNTTPLMSPSAKQQSRTIFVDPDYEDKLRVEAIWKQYDLDKSDVLERSEAFKFFEVVL